MEGIKRKNTIILFNEYFYKEIDLDSYNKEKIVISNSDECDIKLKIEIEDIFIFLVKEYGNWVLEEGENVYYIKDGIKIRRKKLCHGDEISVNSNNKQELFKMNFFLDFTSGKESYDKWIVVEDLQEVKFGKALNNTIIIDDDLVDEYQCVLKLHKNGEEVIDLDSRYSVYINGKRVFDRERIYNNDFIIICGYKFLYKDKKVYFSNYNKKITVSNKEIEFKPADDSILTYPEFTRTPRIIYKLPDTEVEIVAPPKKEEKKGVLDSFIGIIPMIGMAALTLSIGYGSNKIYRIGMVLVTILSTSLVLIITNTRVKKKTKKRNAMYLEYINNKEEEIKKLYEEQISVMELLYPTVNEAINTVYDFKRRIWEKSYDDSDFLEIFLGKGTVDISFKVSIPKEEFGEREDELLLLPNEVRDKYKTIDNMPITINLNNYKSIGITGKVNIVDFIKNMIIEIAAYHYYEDVNIVCLVNKEEEENWKWTRWLPHTWGVNNKVRFLGIGKESSHYVLTILNDILKQRIDSARNGSKDIKGKPHYIIFITDYKLLENEEIVEILENEINLDITIVYAYGDLNLIPKRCTCLIDILSENKAIMRNVNEGNKSISFNYEVYDKEIYENVARRMAPVYVKKMYSQNTLPKSITLFELYKVKSARQFNFIQNWSNNDVCKSISAPLGVSTSGEILDLNLHEKYHGPHGLVAGTTGSGKSEILQSLIISLAINYHPYDVGFILIDYKGGGMANLFSDLPHLIGTITNLDGNLVNRSLTLIKSELKRRQKIFSQFDVNHIDGYKKLEKKDKSLEPLPHLIIIADEFAELKSDQPEFMKELVSTARIGRSLGVHLILATQKPTGVVDSQIWSNSKFKLCLKVQDEGDSKEILKRPDAASIVEPGRAYFQVGNNEIYQLFQSAWSGAKKYVDDDISNDDIEICEVSIEGKRKVIYSSKENNKGKEQITQLDESIYYINKEFNKNGFKKVDNCWIEPLDNVIYIENLIKEEDYFYNATPTEKSEKLITPIIGMIDCPNKQKQELMRLNFSEDGNLMLIGASGYGKTTFIQSLIISLSLMYSPKEVNIYVLDFGTRTLSIFNKMPQVGDVLNSDDNEKIKNLFKLIKKQILSRKKLFAEEGVSSLSNYKIATNKEMPQIIVLLDNYTAFKEMYEEYIEELLFVSREGSSLGISIVITNSTTNGISYKFTANFKNKLALTCVDKTEYTSILGTGRVAPTSLKGRALVNYEGINEMQIGMFGKSEKEFERVNDIKLLIDKINNNYSGKKAMSIPITPEVIMLKDMINSIDFYEEEYLSIPFGFNSESLENILLSLNNYSSFTLVGESKTGKSNMIKNIIHTCNTYWSNVNFVIFDSSFKALKDISSLSNITKYAITKDEYLESLEYILQEGEKRKELAKEGQDISKNTKLMIIIEDIIELTKHFDRKELDKFEAIAREYKSYNIMIIAAGKDNDFKSNLYSVRFLKALKEAQCGILFDSIANQSFYNIRLKYNEKESELKKGDGYLVLNNKYSRIKTPKYE